MPHAPYRIGTARRPLNCFFQLLGAIGRLQGGDQITQAIPQKNAVIRAVVADTVIGHAIWGPL